MRYVVMTLCVAGLVAGCGSTQEGPASSGAPSTAPSSTAGPPSPTASTPGSSSPAPSTTGGSDADVLEEGGSVQAPAWDVPSREAAVDAAMAAMTAFARPDVEQAVWWRGLAPRLSAPARRAYGTVNAVNVPATRVTGMGTLVDTESPYLAGVDVPTDAGVYRVLLSRGSAGGPWLVERLTLSG